MADAMTFTHEDAEVLRPLVEQRNAQLDAERLEEQRALAAELDQIKARQATEVPPLRADRDLTLDALSRARAAVKQAEATHLDALRALAAVEGPLSWRAVQLENLVAASAPAVLLERIREWRAEHSLQVHVQSTERVVAREAWNAGIERETITDPPVEEIRAWSVALRTAILRAEHMLTQPMTAAEAHSALAEISATIPSRPKAPTFHVTTTNAAPPSARGRLRDRGVATPIGSRALSGTPGRPRKSTAPGSLRTRGARASGPVGRVIGYVRGSKGKAIGDCSRCGRVLFPTPQGTARTSSGLVCTRCLGKG